MKLFPLKICFPTSAENNLTPETIHIHTISLANPAEQARTLTPVLSTDEQEKASRFHFESDRNKYITGRGMLRKLLGSYLGISPQKLQFEYGLHGKPQLTFPRESKIHFNLSHSHELAAYAFTLSHEIGIDIEHVQKLPDLLDTAALYFSQHEMIQLRSLPPNEQVTAFYNCWTRKEAFLKAQGGGINDYLREITVTLLPHELAQLIDIAYAPQDISKWKLETFTPAPDYTGAVAVEQKISAY